MRLFISRDEVGDRSMLALIVDGLELQFNNSIIEGLVTWFLSVPRQIDCQARNGSNWHRLSPVTFHTN